MNKAELGYRWIGSERDFVDLLDIQNIDGLLLGRFGGNSSAGQYKNEDACLYWKDAAQDFEFVVLLDAHNTAQSAEAVLKQVETNEYKLKLLLSRPIHKNFFWNLEQVILGFFQQDTFISACQNVQGETACLIVVRKGKYVWWFSVGDCLAYLFHPELESLGQYQLNQRQFFEWIGEVNTFDQLIPCYTIGTRGLREGMNRLFLTTDGLVECPGGVYAESASIKEAMEKENGIDMMLNTIKDRGVRDSTTIITWEIHNGETAAMPSNG